MTESLALSGSQCDAIVAHLLAHPDLWEMHDRVSLGADMSTEDEFSGHHLNYSLFALGLWDSHIGDLDLDSAAYDRYEEDYGEIGRFNVTLRITDKYYEKIGQAEGEITSIAVAKVLRAKVKEKSEAAKRDTTLKTTIIRAINGLSS